MAWNLIRCHLQVPGLWNLRAMAATQFPATCNSSHPCFCVQGLGACPGHSVPCYYLPFFSLISERLPSSHGRFQWLSCNLSTMTRGDSTWTAGEERKKIREWWYLSGCETLTLKLPKGSSRQQGWQGGLELTELCMWRPAPIPTSCLQPWTPYRYNLKTPLNPIGCTKKLASDVGVSKFQGTWALFPNEPVLEHYSIRALYFEPCLVAVCKVFEMASFYIWSTKHRLITK